MYRNVLWGLKWGLSAAAGFSLIAALIYVLGSGVSDTNDMSLGTVVMFYFVAGTVGGVFLGVLHPLVRSRATAAGVGFLVAVPTMVAVHLALYGMPRERSDFILIFSMAAFFGPLAGIGEWNRELREKAARAPD